MNPDSPDDHGDTRWLLSALADGEGDADGAAQGCAAWARADSDARRSWHAYHLIGDVLRSEDLASSTGHDRAFLDRLRARLADEPVALVPPSAVPPASVADAIAPRQLRRNWVMPLAMAAGVTALALGAVLTLGPGAPTGSPSPQLAAAPAEARPVAADLSAPAALAAGTAVVGTRVLRDAQLDRYLRAHREYGTALPGSLPGGSGRSIATVSFDR